MRSPRRIVLVVLIVLAFNVPGLVSPATAQSGKGWEFGEYQQFTLAPGLAAPSWVTTTRNESARGWPTVPP